MLFGIREQLKSDLGDWVDFFDKGGVDHDHGGFCCGLAHDGRRLTDRKFIWFNGRGVWV